MKLLLTTLLLTSVFGYTQTVMPVEEAKQNGLLNKVEKEYKGALGDNGIFKTEADQQKHIETYYNFLKSFGEYLLKIILNGKRLPKGGTGFT